MIAAARESGESEGVNWMDGVGARGEGGEGNIQDNATDETHPRPKTPVPKADPHSHIPDHLFLRKKKKKNNVSVRSFPRSPHSHSFAVCVCVCMREIFGIPFSLTPPLPR